MRSGGYNETGDKYVSPNEAMMKKKTHISEKLKLIITDMSTRQDPVKYNIAMAIIATFLIAVSTMTIFLVELITRQNVSFYYLLMSLVMLPFLFFYMYTYNSSKKISKFQILITHLFPYVVLQIIRS